MKTVIVSRTFLDSKQSLGELSVNENGVSLFSCKTLELPWKENRQQISCIPPTMRSNMDGLVRLANTYKCKYTKSPLFSKNATAKARLTDPNHPEVEVYTYAIQNVPGRAGIRIHAAAYYYHLLGCIGLGSALKDLNADQELDIIHSGDTCRKFVEVMGKEDFDLEIIETLSYYNGTTGKA